LSHDKVIAGVDEAGRGPLAGPVVAAAVILNPARPIDGLDDSKKLSPRKREVLETEIREKALHWAVASASVEEIDTINILQATMLAMQRAVAGLAMIPTLVLVDGNKLPALPCPGRAVVGGDAIHAQISAASILAKQERDRRMLVLAGAYPQYGFDRHKGYPTRAHIEALDRYGVSVHHRRSYAPVRRLIST
jgi:ribonuclease HII